MINKYSFKSVQSGHCGWSVSKNQTVLFLFQADTWRDQFVDEMVEAGLVSKL